MQWLTVTLCEQRVEVAKQDASITADNALSCNRSLQAGSPCHHRLEFVTNSVFVSQG